MIRCPEPYPSGDPRPCARPSGHEGNHGGMTSAYHRFKPVRKVAEYLGTPGPEPSGTALTYAALDAYSDSVNKDQPCELVVVGEQVREDGVRFLTYGATKEYIEATTTFRDAGKGLHYYCPLCKKTGPHPATCKG